MVGLVAARVVLDGLAATAEEDGEDEEQEKGSNDDDDDEIFLDGNVALHTSFIHLYCFFIP